MDIQITNSAFALRFRRWSRAGYAIFRSLSRTVNIGQLNFLIADKSLHKSVGIYVGLPFGIDFEDSAFEDEEALTEALSVQKNEIILSEMAFDLVAAQDRQTNIYSSKRLKKGCSFLNRFYF